MFTYIGVSVLINAMWHLGTGFMLQYTSNLSHHSILIIIRHEWQTGKKKDNKLKIPNHHHYFLCT